MNDFFLNSLNHSKTQFFDFNEILINNGLIVLGKYNSQLIQNTLSKNNQIILFITDSIENIDLDLLKSPSITVICNHQIIFNSLIKDKSIHQLFLRPTYDNISINVILLLRDNSRVDHVNKRLSSIIQNIKIFPAIDALTPHAIDNCVRKEKLPILKPIRAGKIGCLFSHLLLWKELIMGTYPAMLILEDDNLPIDDFISKFQLILDKLSPTFDILHLCIPTHLENSKILLQTQLPCAETCAYLISRKGAAKLLNNLKEIREPLNIIIQKQILLSNLEAYSVGESIFTNIGKNTPFKDDILSSNTTASKIYVPGE